MVIKVMLGNGTNDCFRINTQVEEIIFYPERGQFVEIKPIADEWAMQRIEFRHDDARYMVQWNTAWEMIPASVKTFRVTLEDVHSTIE